MSAAGGKRVTLLHPRSSSSVDYRDGLSASTRWPKFCCFHFVFPIPIKLESFSHNLDHVIAFPVNKIVSFRDAYIWDSELWSAVFTMFSLIISPGPLEVLALCPVHKLKVS